MVQFFKWITIGRKQLFSLNLSLCAFLSSFQTEASVNFLKGENIEELNWEDFAFLQLSKQRIRHKKVCSCRSFPPISTELCAGCRLHVYRRAACLHAAWLIPPAPNGTFTAKLQRKAVTQPKKPRLNHTGKCGSAREITGVSLMVGARDASEVQVKFKIEPKPKTQANPILYNQFLKHFVPVNLKKFQRFLCLKGLTKE